MIHSLKTETEHFENVLSGKKTFELRQNDRGYQVGDTLSLQEFDGGGYTDREVDCTVTQILFGPTFGFAAGVGDYVDQVDRGLGGRGMKKKYLSIPRMANLFRREWANETIRWALRKMEGRK